MATQCEKRLDTYCNDREIRLVQMRRPSGNSFGSSAYMDTTVRICSGCRKALPNAYKYVTPQT